MQEDGEEEEEVGKHAGHHAAVARQRRVAVELAEAEPLVAAVGQQVEEVLRPEERVDAHGARFVACVE